MDALRRESASGSKSRFAFFDLVVPPSNQRKRGQRVENGLLATKEMHLRTFNPEY